MNLHLKIYESSWVDHDRGWLTRWRVTVSEATARRMSTEAAVVLSLCVPPVLILVRRFSLALINVLLTWAKSFVAWIRRPRQNAVNGSPTPIPLQDIGAPENTTSLQQALNAIGDEDNPLKAMQSLYTGLRDVRDTEDSIIKELKMVIARDVPSVFKRFLEDPYLAVSVFVVSIIILGLTISIIVLGISASGLDSDNLGSRVGRSPSFLSMSVPTWWLSNNVLDKMMLEDRVSLAEEHAETCYKDSNHESDCKLLFPSKQIPSDGMWYYTKCPFDDDVCVEGDEGITVMTTGLVDSKVLGINTRPSNRFAFERNMTCAPLINDDRYQERKGHAWLFKYEDGYQRYYYSTEVPGPAGFDYRNQQEEVSDPFLVTAPPARFENRYEAWVSKFDPFLTTHPSNKSSFPDELFLSPQFHAGNKIVTLLFVASPNAVLHSYPKEDAVFPASTELPPITDDGLRAEGFWPETYWFNNSTRAGVLGCVDSFKICDLAGSTCWDQGQLMLNSDSADGYASPRMIIPSSLSQQQRYPFFLVAASLIRSTAFDAMHSISNRALHFNKESNDAFSNGAGAKQWEIEAQKMFKTSLARMQVDMLYLSLGHTLYFHSTENLNNAPKVVEDLHTSLVFPALGHRNVDASWFIGINLLCLLVFLSSRRYSTPQKRRSNIGQGLDGGYHDNLWIAIFLKNAFSLLKLLYRAAVAVLKKFWVWVGIVWSKIRRH